MPKNQKEEYVKSYCMNMYNKIIDLNKLIGNDKDLYVRKLKTMLDFIKIISSSNLLKNVSILCK